MDDGMKRLKRAFENLRSLGALGTDVTLRRAIDIVANELNAQNGKPARECYNDDRFRFSTFKNRFEGIDEFETEKGKRFLSSLNETGAGQRHQMVRLDQMENLVLQFIELLSGRNETLEIGLGKEADRTAISEAHSFAKKILIARDPSVGVKNVTADNVEDRIFQLRSLAYYLENRNLEEEAEVDFGDDPIGRERGQSCQYSGTHMWNEFRWKDNGRVLEQMMADEYTCATFDDCCLNDVFYQRKNVRWIVVWNDGDSSKKPPRNPLPFEEQPWDNRCPVFSGVMGKMTSDYGWRKLENDPEPDFHPGIDLGVVVGTEVFATNAGKVVYVQEDLGDGKSGVHIRSGNTTYDYWHIQPSVTQNSEVVAGAKIGVTAAYRRPHLHYAKYDSRSGRLADKYSVEPCP